MRLTILFLIAGLMQVSASLYSQNTKLNLEFRNTSVLEVLEAIENQSEFRFAYSPIYIDIERKVDVEIKDKSIDQTLSILFHGTEVNYSINDRHIMLFLANETASQAQQGKLISGKVTDSSGATLPGVSVVIKGTTSGVITDMDGKYSLSNAPENAILQFSFVGMKTQEVAVGSKSIINVTLAEDAIGIEEVVAVGYGTQKKATLTGAISNITGDNLTTTKRSNVSQALQGKIAGVQIRQTSGQPGANTTSVNVRGFGTPIFVIDDVTSSITDFNRLNPEDIESVSVLKDGSAAIYGMNADNGVIIVTTKKGKAGKVKLSYSGSFGFTTPTSLPTMVNAAHYVETWNESTMFIYGTPYVSKEELDKWKTGGPGYESTDWYAETMKKYSTQQLHSISLSGGNEVVSFYSGFGYSYDGGLLKSNALDFQKGTLTNNMSINITKNLKANINLNGRYAQTSQPNAGFNNIFFSTGLNSPLLPSFINGDPNYPGFVEKGNNSVVLSDPQYGMNTQTEKFIRTNIDLTYSFDKNLHGLKLKLAGFYDSNQGISNNVSKTVTLYDKMLVPTVFRTPATVQVGNSDLNRLNLQAQILYDKTFAQKHKVGGTLVYEAKRSSSSSTTTGRQFDDFFTSDIISQGSTTNMISEGTNNQTANISLIGRFNYAYNGKYLAEYAFRYDGSYRYASEKRWGFFPVVSVGWRASEEKFVKDALPFITNLKFRGSYGKLGRDLGDPFQYVEGFVPGSNELVAFYDTYRTTSSYYEFKDGTQTTGISAPAVVNNNLTWMNITTKDIGFDLSILKNVVDVEFDLYEKIREGLLATRNVSLPNTFGATMPQENLNSDMTQGVELTLGTKGKIGSVNYQVSGNFNYFRSKNVYVERAPFTNSFTKWKNLSAGRWSDVDFIYQTSGQFQSFDEIEQWAVQDGNQGNTKEYPGDIKYIDADGNGKIDGNDKLPIGWDKTPNLDYGLTIAMQWKGFDMSMLWQGSALYEPEPASNWAYSSYFNLGSSLPELYYDRWHPVNIYGDLRDMNNWAPGKWPAIRENGGNSAIFLESKQSTFWRKRGDYVRFKNLEIGYTIPDRIIKKAKLSKVRIYVNGYNLITFADPYFKYFDPEVTASGTAQTVTYQSGFVYPLSKVYNFGINVTF